MSINTIAQLGLDALLYDAFKFFLGWGVFSLFAAQAVDTALSQNLYFFIYRH